MNLLAIAMPLLGYCLAPLACQRPLRHSPNLPCQAGEGANPPPSAHSSQPLTSRLKRKGDPFPLSQNTLNKQPQKEGVTPCIWPPMYESIYVYQYLIYVYQGIVYTILYMYLYSYINVCGILYYTLIY